MPIYEYSCECGSEVEKIQAIGSEAPACQCGGVMHRKCGSIARLILKNEGGYPIRSKEYRIGYKKEYLRSKGQEEWRDTIISP